MSLQNNILISLSNLFPASDFADCLFKRPFGEGGAAESSRYGDHTSSFAQTCPAFGSKNTYLGGFYQTPFNGLSLSYTQLITRIWNIITRIQHCAGPPALLPGTYNSVEHASEAGDPDGSCTHIETKGCSDCLRCAALSHKGQPRQFYGWIAEERPIFSLSLWPTEGFVHSRYVQAPIQKSREIWLRLA